MAKQKIYGIVRAIDKAVNNPDIQLPVTISTARRWWKEDPTTALAKLIKKAGGQVKLANALGVAQRTISHWLEADMPVAERPVREPRNDVERVVATAGGQPKVASDLGVTQQCIGNWCKKGYVPVARAQEFEMLYGVPRTSIINPKLRNALGAGGEL